MVDNGINLGITQLAKRRHYPSGPAQTDGPMQKYIIDGFQEGRQSQRDANPAIALVPVTGRTMCPVQLASIRRTPGNTEQAYQKQPQHQSHFLSVIQFRSTSADI
jgi:hypothetical protein